MMSVSTPASISLSQVTLRYGSFTALDKVSLEVAPGERVCVLGANGSGKSTLASVMCGLLAPDEGEVSLLGQQVYSTGKPNFEAYREARRNIGLVFQSPDDQIVTTVVEEDIAFGPENLGFSSERISKVVERELKRAGLITLARADPTKLSGGQRQRVAIAGALAMEPKVLVLDEPGAQLDVRGRRGIMRVMGELSGSGVTIVHVTHFMEEALVADRVIVLNRGRIVLEGTPAEVFSHGEELHRLGLEMPFGAQLAEQLRSLGVPVPWTSDEQELKEAIITAVKTAQKGSVSGVACAPLLQPITAETTSLSFESVSFSYGNPDGRRQYALKDVSVRIPSGERVAIIGQTGSGKSTMLRLLCALEVPDSGRILVEGIDTSKKRERRRLHGHIGYVMQHPERQLFAETIWEDVAFGPRNLKLSTEEVERRCRKALKIVGLSDRADASPFELSGGQQRLAAIAGVLAMEPSTIVLDEPMAGLDPQGRLQLKRILRHVNSLGVTVLQVTHSMTSATAAHHVIVLDDGHVLMEGSPCEVFSPEARELLRSSGLGMPDPLAWALELEEAGCAALGDPLTIEDLARAIAQICGVLMVQNPARNEQEMRYVKAGETSQTTAGETNQCIPGGLS